MKLETIELQIKAIQKKIDTGKVKNIYAAKARIKKLEEIKTNINHFNFLAQ